MTDWQSGFTSGVTATLIGFLCTMFWDVYKYKRDTADQEKNVVDSIIDDVSANIEIVLKNRNLIQGELDGLPKGRMLVVPLQVFRTGFWDLLKVERPDCIVKTGSLFSDLKEVHDALDYIDECIKGRQLYKMTNMALTSLYTDIEKQDEILMYHFNVVRPMLDNVLAALGNLTKRSGKDELKCAD